MTKFIEWLATLNTVTVTEAIRQVILSLVLFEVIRWDEHQIAGFLMAVSAVLALFARGTTVSHGRVEQKVDEKVALREIAGTTGTAANMSPPTKQV